MEVVEGGISRVALGKRLCGPDDEEVGAGGLLYEKDCFGSGSFCLLLWKRALA